MSIKTRQVKNKRNQDGSSTKRAGTVYDVFINYKTSEGYKSYGKRGFATKQEAKKHESEMKIKLINPTYEPVKAVDTKQTVKEYMEKWVESHGNVNLRPSTIASYKSHMKNHIFPYIGNVPLKSLTPAMLDNMFVKLFERKLAQSTVKYAQRILSVALEAARKYRYIETNPARDIITKFGKNGNTPDPYTVEQMQVLIGHCMGNEWEMIVMLSGMYGLRRGEVLGLRWQNVDLENRIFSVQEQLPFKIPPKATIIGEFAPTKSQDRVLPITKVTLPYFERQLQLQTRQKELAAASGQPYYENDLVIAKANGAPVNPDKISSYFGQLLRHQGLPHIRFHDLRHSAATNMHQLTGDFYTVGEILGHTLKGIGMSLGISTNFDAATATYVDVRLERKQTVLEAYHNAVYPEMTKDIVIKESPPKDRGAR